MNVSKEANAEFMRQLRKEDPARYRRLCRNIEQGEFAARRRKALAEKSQPSKTLPLAA